MLQSCRCCCCQMPLDRSSRVIGLSLMILSIMSAVRSFVSLMALSNSSMAQSAYKTDDLEEIRTVLLWKTCLSAVAALFGAVLVTAVSRRAPCLVIIFLSYFGLSLGISICTLLYAFFDPMVLIERDAWEQLRDQDPETVRIIVYSSIFIGLAVAGFFCYLWLVVFSFYRELTSGADEMLAGPPGTWNAKHDGQQIPMV